MTLIASPISQLTDLLEEFDAYLRDDGTVLLNLLTQFISPPDLRFMLEQFRDALTWLYDRLTELEAQLTQVDGLATLAEVFGQMLHFLLKEIKDIINAQTDPNAPLPDILQNLLSLVPSDDFTEKLSNLGNWIPGPEDIRALKNGVASLAGTQPEDDAILPTLLSALT